MFSKFFITLFIFSINLNAHDSGLSREIEFPDIKGYKTLVCDLHMHSVFSDGSVWPTIRVQESFKDGLDAISLTEHLEYQPYSADIPNPDRNRSYHVAKKYADDENKKLDETDKLLVINGQEITRKMPPGHINAIFLEDANPLLDLEDSVKAVKSLGVKVSIDSAKDSELIRGSKAGADFVLSVSASCGP